MIAIAQAAGVPAPFLSKVLGRLVDRGLLRSRRGRGGGFVLGRPASDITLADVALALERRDDLERAFPPVAGPLGSRPRARARRLPRAHAAHPALGSRRRREDASFAVKDLHAFLDVLRGENELATVEAEADPRLEIPEIHRRVIEAGGKALLFKRPKGADFPVVTNLFGTQKRLDLAFGKKPREFVETAARAAAELLPPTGEKLWEFRSFFGAALRVGTKRTPRRPRAGRRGGHARSRAPARPHAVAGGRRSVPDAASRIHGTSRAGANRISASTACRSTARGRQASTGRSRRAAGSTTTRPRRAAWPCRSRFSSAVRPRSSSRRSRRSPRGCPSFSSPRFSSGRSSP